MYFSKFPRIKYKISGNRFRESPKYVLAIDITAAARIVRGVVKDITTYDSYTIGDYETPEIAAEILWGQPEWHWILMLLNDIFHPSDWVMSSKDFEGMIAEKYGSIDEANSKIAYYEDDENNVVLPQTYNVGAVTKTPYMNFTDSVGFHHIRWVDGAGKEVEEPPQIEVAGNLHPVTYYQQESRLNEAKRTIKIIDKKTAEYIAAQYGALMRGG